MNALAAIRAEVFHGCELQRNALAQVIGGAAKIDCHASQDTAPGRLVNWPMIPKCCQNVMQNG